ncbi:MAG: hypothetical protein UW39_C0005G0044 [Parcubacteria group bacterium GW2011_GWC2_44_17]|nr:MAG: hypothetical protein UW39_C0005G0044 [Parcubacteria group bacterium GW2011_GWC2_44_17]KKT48705.1 MAG: hypothetical protein UW40_C0035G0008 [Parcubacteria group bacterium GW2011_GWF2_44_17]
MNEDKVLKEIHALQRKKNKGLSWDQQIEQSYMVAKKIAKKYGYRIYPKEKSPYAMKD